MAEVKKNLSSGSTLRLSLFTAWNGAVMLIDCAKSRRYCDKLISLLFYKQDNNKTISYCKWQLHTCK